LHSAEDLFENLSAMLFSKSRILKKVKQAIAIDIFHTDIFKAL